MTSSSRPASASWNGTWATLLFEGVQQQGMPSGGAQRGCLVHAARGSAGNLVLSPHADGCQTQPGRRHPRRPGPGRTARPGPGRQRTRWPPRRRARRRAARTSRSRRRTRRACGPSWVRDHAGPPAYATQELTSPGAIPSRVPVQTSSRSQRGHQAHDLVVPATDGHERAVRQRHGQAQPAVVVDVLPDEVHPAGRRPHPVGIHLERADEQAADPPGTLRARPRGKWSSHRPLRWAGGMVAQPLIPLLATFSTK